MCVERVNSMRETQGIEEKKTDERNQNFSVGLMYMSFTSTLRATIICL